MWALYCVIRTVLRGHVIANAEGDKVPKEPGPTVPHTNEADFRHDGDILPSPHGPGAGKLKLKMALGYPEKCGRARRLLRMLGGLVCDGSTCSLERLKYTVFHAAVRCVWSERPPSSSVNEHEPHRVLVLL